MDMIENPDEMMFRQMAMDLCDGKPLQAC